VLLNTRVVFSPNSKGLKIITHNNVAISTYQVQVRSEIIDTGLKSGSITGLYP